MQRPEDIQKALQYARERGALTSCNHPKPFGPGWDYPQVTNFHCVEVWNGPWTGLNEMSLEYWLNLIAGGRQVAAVGGSDFHTFGERSGSRERRLGSPANWVHVSGEPCQENILAALRRGHVSLSEDPLGPYLELRCGANNEYMGGDQVAPPPGGQIPVRVLCRAGSGSLLRLLDQDGALLEQEITSDDLTVHFQADPARCRYIRTELRSPDFEMRALTNPIYFI